MPAGLFMMERAPEDALASPLRRRILDLVEARPGSPVTDLARRLSIHPVTLHYHLRRLEESDLVRSQLAGRRRVVFPVSAYVDENAEDRALLLEPTARRIALAILHRPNITITDLVEELHETPRVVYYHVKRLRDAGLVVGASATHYRGLEAAPRLALLLSEGP